MTDPQVIYLYDFNIDGRFVKNWTAQIIEEVQRNGGFNVREYSMGDSSEIKQVTTWIDAAGQEPSVRNVANYLAYTMSELAESLRASDDVFLFDLGERIERCSMGMRDGIFDHSVAEIDKVELLDGAIDTAWCAIGLAHMLADAQGAFDEVVRSNYSKFEGGVCQLDATGKVVKGPSYFKPELAKFLRGASDV